MGYGTDHQFIVPKIDSRLRVPYSLPQNIIFFWCGKYRGRKRPSVSFYGDCHPLRTPYFPSHYSRTLVQVLFFFNYIDKYYINKLKYLYPNY